MKFFEIEQKYRLRNPKTMRTLLERAGAKKIRSGVEINEFFDKDQFFQKQKIALRLRRHGRDQATLTLKGPRLKSPFSKRMEIETPVDYRATKALLKFLGCERWMQYRKKRESYRYGAVLITIDRLPGFGWFLEIEARSREIAQIAGKLGLHPGDREARSYLAMISHKQY